MYRFFWGSVYTCINTKCTYSEHKAWHSSFLIRKYLSICSSAALVFNMDDSKGHKTNKKQSYKNNFFVILIGICVVLPFSLLGTFSYLQHRTITELSERVTLLELEVWRRDVLDVQVTGLVGFSCPIDTITVISVHEKREKNWQN